MISREAQITDKRTGEAYTAHVWDAKETYGKIRWQLTEGGPWFEPTGAEMASIRGERA